METDEANNEAKRFAILIGRRAKVSTLTADSKWTAPQLKYTRKLVNDCGQEYITALQDALFSRPEKPYIPDSAPDFNDDSSSKEHTCETCNDRFYIESSLEDHMTRGSWILGYWCSYCFVSCKHSLDATSCVECRTSYFNRYSALHKRGFKKGKTPGVVKVFFNKCEFFAHLRMHGIISVLTKEIMLMPFPSGVQKEHYTHLKLLCEAVMDQMFILNIHIQNWFVDNCVSKSWWRVKNAQVDRMVKMYNKNYKWIDNNGSNEDEIVNTMHEKIQSYKNNVNIGKASSTPVLIDSDSDMESEQNSENQSTDITFVDCGSCEPVRSDTEKSISWKTSTAKSSFGLPPGTSRNIHSNCNPFSCNIRASSTLPKISVKKFANTNSLSPTLVKSTLSSTSKVPTISTPQSPLLLKPTLTIPTSASMASSVSSIMASSSSNTTPTMIVKNVQTTPMRTAFKSKSAMLPKRAGKGFLGKLIKSPNGKYELPKFPPGPRVVTVETSESLDLSSIIKKLPPDVANSKKIVFIGKDSTTVVSPSELDKQENRIIKNSGETIQLQNNSKVRDRILIKSPIKNDPPVTKFLPGQLFLKTMPIQQLTTTKQTLNKSKCNDVNVYNVNLNSPIQKQSVNAIQRVEKLLSSLVPIRPKPDDKTSNTCIPSFSSFVKQPKNTKVGNSSGLLKVSEKTTLLKSSETVQNNKKNNATAVNKEVKLLSPATISSSSDLFFVSIRQASKAILDRFFNEHQQKCLSIIKHTDDKCYLTFKNDKDFSDSENLIWKYRQWMVSHYTYLEATQLQKMIDHFRNTSKQFLTVMNLPYHEITHRHDEVISIIEKVLEKNKVSIKNSRNDYEYQYILEQWESDRQVPTDPQYCSHYCFTCYKILKPKTYLMGLSAKAQDESIYCSCYNCICHKCQIYVGSLSHYHVHMHYHKNETPFRCPECFEHFHSSSSLEVHLWTDCFHPIIRRFWSCNICLTSGFCSMEAIMQHFALMHCDIKIACEWCRMVFKQHSSYWVHMKHGHPTIKQIGQPLRLIVCQIDKCAVPIECFRFHMEDHTGIEEVVHYRCPKCAFSTTKKGIIKTHIFDRHFTELRDLMSTDAFNELMIRFTKVPKIISAQTISSEVFEQNTENLTNLSTKKNSKPRQVSIGSKVDGPHNNVKAQSRASKVPNLIKLKKNIKDVYEESNKSIAKYNESSFNKNNNNHTLLSKSNNSLLVNTFREEALENDTDDESADNPLQVLYPSETFDDSLVENLLSEDELSLSSPIAKNPSYMLRNGGRIRIALNGPSIGEEIVKFNCHICGELINTSQSVISNHFHEKHKQNYELCTISPRLTYLDECKVYVVRMQHLSSPKRKSDSFLPSSKRRKRWTPKKHVEKNYVSPDRPTGICVEVESPDDGEGRFKCKKCNEIFVEIGDMREHIAKNHRLNNEYLVCLECGQNFVVAPSLHMHLKVYHGIEDPEFYLSQNTRCAPAVIALEAKAKTIEPNQCYVCMAVFQDKATVDKHLRVHGMAFLNRKYIENATRTTTKNSDANLIDNNISHATENGIKQITKKVETKTKHRITIENESSQRLEIIEMES